MSNTQPKRHPDRPKYRFGTGGWSNAGVVYAYTREEWGLGGHSAAESANVANSFIGQSIVAVLMTVPALLAPLGVLLGIVVTLRSIPDPGEMSMGLVVIFGSLMCTLLFTGGWLLSISALRGELRARKLRKPKGLPKPMYAVTDDQARAWFEQHPGILEITRENFPNSTHPFPGEPGFAAPRGPGNFYS
jgi:hypothetical protein